MALSLRDTEWRQRHRHLALCHGSTPPLTNSVWPTQAARRTHAQVVCLSGGASKEEICCIDLCAFYLPLHVVVCVVLALSQHLCVCVCVVMWWCSVRVLKPVVSVVASVTLTASLSTQELLSHAGCFCQSWAEAVTPQRFTALCVRAADGWAPVAAEQTAPCCQLWSSYLDFIFIAMKCLKIILHGNHYNSNLIWKMINIHAQLILFYSQLLILWHPVYKHSCLPHFQKYTHICST